MVDGKDYPYPEPRYYAYLVSIVTYVLVLSLILKNSRQPFPNLWEELDTSFVTDSSIRSIWLFRVQDLQMFLRDRDRLYPSLYYRLELGCNLQEAAMNLLHRFRRTKQENVM